MAISSGLHPVARLDQLQDGVGRLVLVDGVEIALFRTGDEVRAIAARCPHSGGPLQEGMVCGEVVVCPLHQRRVDLRSGAVDDWERAVATYEAVVEDGKILIRLP